MVQQDIKAQDLEAGAATGVVRKAGVIIMFEDRMSRDQCFNDDVLNVAPHFLCVASDGFQISVQGGQFSV